MSTKDIRVYQAKLAHKEASGLVESAVEARARRDKLIREVYAEGGWSYSQLAERIGCSQALIAHIIRHPS